MNRDHWNAASQRLEDFLRSQRLSDRLRLIEVTSQLLAAARARHAQDPAAAPVETTLRTAQDEIDRWFAGLIDDEGEPLRRAAQARVAYFATGADRRWPDAFLSPHPPPELRAAVRAFALPAGPAMDFRSLLRKEIDYGPMEDIARETWDQFSWGHVLRAFAIWVAVFFAAYGAYLHYFP